MPNALTKYQKKMAREISDLWLTNAFAPRDLNKGLIEEAIPWIYRSYDFSRPRIIYARSPMECQKIAARLKDEASHNGRSWNNIYGAQIQYEIERQAKQTPADKIAARAKQDLWTASGHTRHLKFTLDNYFRVNIGQGLEQFSADGFWALDWCSYYDFLKEIKLLKLADFDRYREFIFDSGIFMGIYEAAAAIVCPHPKYARFNEKLDLHCHYGPAVAWEDNFRLYYLNGIITSEVFFMPAGDLDPSMLLREQNAEARKEIIKKLGIKRVIRSLGAANLDKWDKYELLAIEIPSMTIRPTYLKMLNPSTGDWHVEGVPPTVSTCKEALAWRDEENEYILPEQLT